MNNIGKYGCKNELGNVYGDLTVIERAPNQGTRAMWKCKCVCGNTIICRGTELRNGTKINCGCKNSSLINLSGKIFGVYEVLYYNTNTKKWVCNNLTTGEKVEREAYSLTHSKNTGVDRTQKNISPGDKFGLWTVIERIERDDVVSRARYFKCKCECGSIGIVSASALTNGGSISCGCLRSKGEKKISEVLNKLGIEFKKEYVFKDCKNIRPLPFDFYLPKYNTCIEYDGRQHFGIKNGWNNTDEIKLRDHIKDGYCKQNGIKLIRIPYTDYVNIFNIIVKICTEKCDGEIKI